MQNRACLLLFRKKTPLRKNRSGEICCRNNEQTIYGYALAFASCNFMRAALFLWIRPLANPWSISFCVAATTSGVRSDLSSFAAVMVRFTVERSLDFAARLLWVLAAVTATRFLADLIFGKSTTTFHNRISYASASPHFSEWINIISHDAVLVKHFFAKINLNLPIMF